MAWFYRLDSRPHPRPRQRQIPDAIQGLVPHELVRPAERRSDHTILVEHDGVVERRAFDQALRAQLLHFVHEPKGARPGKLARKRLGRDTVTPGLTSDDRMAKIDRHMELEVEGR